ncbi:Cna B-type domain-containing protein [Jeotgalibaca ciconiae]|uniref:Cna B-type domain-containing protein n=1 Tax=Jeotgalibaca ciconiae TaxID=2496265 RepID=A0A3Q9BLM5_9LACT|nr:Cna B-type domain-containing protein [Jeotgalibaca ciconiae]AZP04796.1 Cna B-type domain-containing protein [Jeotgalibaca ciconiae]
MAKKMIVRATKEWKNDWPNNRPEIWFKLFRKAGENGTLEEVPNLCIKPLASWTTEVRWKKVDARSPEGVDYIYSVQEVDVKGNNYTPAGYTKFENGLSVINIYNPNPIAVSIQLDRSEELIESNLVAEEFDFELVDTADRLVVKGEKNGNGTVIFESIDFTELGIHEFSIVLIKKTNREIHKIFNVTVEVIYADGNLFATTSYIKPN